MIGIDDDRLLDAIGVFLAGFIVLALAVAILAGATAPGREAAEPPDVNWTIHRVDVGHVRIVHAGGEPIDASKLVVSVEGIEHGVGRSDVLREGDAITVPARSGQSIQLSWVAKRDEHVPIASWTAP